MIVASLITYCKSLPSTVEIYSIKYFAIIDTRDRLLNVSGYWIDFRDRRIAEFFRNIIKRRRLQKSVRPVNSPAASEPPLSPLPKDQLWSGVKGYAVLTISLSSSRWRSCCFVVAQTDPQRGFSWGCPDVVGSVRRSVRSSNPEERVPVMLRSSHMWN